MTRLELANQLIENQSAFHFAFIPGYVSEPRAVARWIDRSSCVLIRSLPLPVLTRLVRVERFAPLTKLVLSQPPLPIGLHARDVNWYSREDSNLQDGRFELPMSAGLITRAKAFPIFDCRLPI